MNDFGIIFTKTPTANMDVISNTLYLVEGLIIMVVNAGLFFRIIALPNLRNQKEFAIMAACVLFDTFFGATYFASGIWRTYIYLSFKFIPASTRWACFATVHVQLFTMITPAAGYLLVLTALDRFFCVFFPIKYVKTPAIFCYAAVILPYVFTLPTWGLSYLGSSNDRIDLGTNMICLMPDSVPVKLYQTMRLIRIFSCLLVVVIYIPVGVRMYNIIRKHQIQSGMNAQTQKKLIKLTTTIALITVNNLILFTIPDIITYFNPTVPTYTFYIMNLNKGIVNLIALFATQKPMRRLVYKTASKVTKTTVHLKSVSTVVLNTHRKEKSIYPTTLM